MKVLKLDVNKHRINEFLLFKDKLEKLLNHYEKIRRKWKKANKAFEIISATILFSTAGIIGTLSLGTFFVSIPIISTF